LAADDEGEEDEEVQAGSARVMSEKAKGKRRAVAADVDVEAGEGTGAEEGEARASKGTGKREAVKEKEDLGRSVTIIFANEGPEGGKVDVWVEEGESVGKVKDKVSWVACDVVHREVPGCTGYMGAEDIGWPHTAHQPRTASLHDMDPGSTSFIAPRRI
jgi:hypothetical protein